MELDLLVTVDRITSDKMKVVSMFFNLECSHISSMTDIFLFEFVLVFFSSYNFLLFHMFFHCIVYYLKDRKNNTYIVSVTYCN